METLIEQAETFGIKLSLASLRELRKKNRDNVYSMMYENEDDKIENTEKVHPPPVLIDKKKKNKVSDSQLTLF